MNLNHVTDSVLYIGVNDRDEGRSREKFEAVLSFAEGCFGDLLRARKK